MTIFIAHAEADQAAAEDIKAFFKSRAQLVETETGAEGFRHLQSTDVVVALWSQNSLFGANRLLFERRMLEAWSNGQLVLVKLDHGFLPVGLRDLPAIDANFAQSRQLVAWPAVERAAKEAGPQAMARLNAPPPAMQPPPMSRSAPALASPTAGGLTSMLGSLFGSRLKRAAAAEAPGSAAGDAPPFAMDKMLADPPATLFISYAHADDAAVTPVVAIVEKEGRAVWIDKTGVKTGDSWAGEIVRAIKAAKGVLVMCSPRAFESDHIKREVYLADRYKKPMVPVFLEAAIPPEDFEYFFANVQWLELFKLPEADRPAAIGKALALV